MGVLEVGGAMTSTVSPIGVWHTHRRGGYLFLLLRGNYNKLAAVPQPRETTMIVLGIILLVIGFVAKIAILWTLGIILVVIGAILALLGMAGREVGGRRHWF
jgi:small-conductance mechanosensitive channel